MDRVYGIVRSDGITRTGKRVLVLVLVLVVDGSGSYSKKSELALTPALAL